MQQPHFWTFPMSFGNRPNTRIETGDGSQTHKKDLWAFSHKGHPTHYPWSCSLPGHSKGSDSFGMWQWRERGEPKITNCMQEQGSIRRHERGQKFLHLQKEMRVVGFSLCRPLIYSLPGYTLFQLLKERVWCKPPDNLLRWSSVDVSSFLLDPVFGPANIPWWIQDLAPATMTWKTNEVGNCRPIQTRRQVKGGASLLSQCFTAPSDKGLLVTRGFSIKIARLDRTSDHWSNQKSAQADQN